MAKKGKKNKDNIPMELQEQYLRMSPTELTVEFTFEQNAIDALKKEAKDNGQIQQIAEEVKALQEEQNKIPDVVKAEEAYKKAKEENMPEGLLEAKENLAALRSGFKNDIKQHAKKLNFIRKTLKSHIESGALKRKA